VTFNRKTPFDIDDDIVLLPNFNSRQVNSVLVIHSFVLGKLTGKVNDVRDYGRYMATAAELVEEGPSIEECMIN
jgi:hypothetical protein